jgi:hypothetical protein
LFYQRLVRVLGIESVFERLIGFVKAALDGCSFATIVHAN